MSPRAAARLATLGFTRVHDYVAGKADWGSFNLPLEGRAGSETRVGAYVRADVPTCRPDEALKHVCERVEKAGWGTCFVVDEAGLVIGRLGRTALGGEHEQSVEDAMTPGPSTVRPSARLEALVKRMREQNLGMKQRAHAARTRFLKRQHRRVYQGSTGLSSWVTKSHLQSRGFGVTKRLR